MRVREIEIIREKERGKVRVGEGNLNPHLKNMNHELNHLKDNEMFFIILLLIYIE